MKNNLFSKLGIALVGMAMAIGVGVAISNNNIKEAKAAEVLAAETVFNTTNNKQSISGYTDTWHNITEGFDWTLVNFNNNKTSTAESDPTKIGSWGYVKCGRKNNASVASIYTTAAVADEITKVTITIDALTISKINTITLYKGSAADDISTSLGTFDKATGTKTINIAQGNRGTNLFYKIVFDCASGSSNGLLTLSNVSLYKESADIYPTSISYTGAKTTNVTGKLELGSGVVFSSNLGDVTVKTLSYSLVSGADYVDLNTTTGVVLGKKSGTDCAVVRITPDNTAGAAPIDVTLSVSAVDAPGIIIGDSFIIYSGNYSMSSYSNNSGIGTAFSSLVPTASYVLSTEAGYFENSVAFKNGTKYLSLNSASNALHISDAINANSSWLVAWNNETNAATITNAAFPDRTLQMNSSTYKFNCYATSQVAISLYKYVATPLTTLSITNPVEVIVNGSTNLEVTFVPENTTENYLNWKSSDEAIATVENGVVSGVAQGNCVVTAWFDADGNGELDQNEISATSNVTVSEFVGTHELVVAASSLANGTKVVIASTDSDYDRVSAPHTGGNNVPATSAFFDRTNKELAVRPGYQEFTVWGIDADNDGNVDCYTLSDGSYFLCSSQSADTKLLRTDVLSERCYFTVVDGVDGVVVQSYHSAQEPAWADGPYSIRYNSASTSNLFSLYSTASTSTKTASLYKNKAAANYIQGFIDTFLHIGTERTNYFEVLKANYAKLSAEQKTALCAEATALARIQEIAAAAYYKLDTSTKEFVPTLASIAVEGQSVSLVAGADFVFGGTVTATYGDESTKVIDNANVTVTGYDMSQAGEQEVTVSYTEDGITKTTKYTLNILEAAVESIAIKTNPTKTTYYVGDKFDAKGLEITATLTNGKTIPISSGFEFSGFDSSKPAESQTITVTVGDKTATFTVKILAIEVSKIEIKKAPTKDAYYVGEQLNTAGLVVKVTKNNGTTEDITTGFTVSGFDSSAAVESQTITVTYEGKTATFTVSIIAIVATRITIKTNPTKTVYLTGEQLDTTGLVITVTKNNGTTEDITTGFTVSGFDSSAAAESQTITVTYQGQTATFTVKINLSPADQLAAAKASAISEVEALVNGLGQANYSEANWALIQAALAEARTTINACENAEEINAALTRIKAAINAVKTLGEVQLDEAKAAALDQLAAYYNSFDQNNYEEEGLAALAAAYLNGQNAINAAEDTDAVATALLNAKAALDAVETKPAPARRRCGGDIAATSIILSALALAGAGLLVFKKRKED